MSVSIVRVEHSVIYIKLFLEHQERPWYLLKSWIRYKEYRLTSWEDFQRHIQEIKNHSIPPFWEWCG
ncbi:unnamed protein product [Clavelina lepadiformis]|uniref:Uncharacterized protein n=1 Tax=Clavelina lepadiformis TaxID=159417 RepID=A0ABP0GWU7_CLALP